jgi:predicted ATPase/class 3 adenylate cyclase
MRYNPVGGFFRDYLKLTYNIRKITNLGMQIDPATARFCTLRTIPLKSTVAYLSVTPMQCSNCKTENPPGKKFCGDCGAPLANLCPKCGADNPAGKRFCGDCGTALGLAAPASRSNDSLIRIAGAPVSENLEGERKTVTALFADIKGSTELEQDLDPEEARAIVDPALRLMIDSVRRYDGYVVQSTGDGIFAIFGAPVAHEDHPQRALYAALRMQEELKRYSAKLVADGGMPIEARVGVNTGEVVVRSISTGGGHVEYTPIGHTANLASRMQAVAPTGSIAISEQTRKFVEGYFQLGPMGPTKVKGVTEPVSVYEVTGLGPLRTRLQRAAGRGLTKFVGREREMEAMRNAAQLARAGHGQIVAAMAEAGTGKSRLFFEFKAENQSGWTVLETFSVSHGKASAYFPVIELLHNYFKIVGDDDERSRRAKVIGSVLALDRALEDALPYLFALLGIVEGDDPLAQTDGQVKRRRTLDSIKRLLLRESLNQPLMVFFEDLHWIDDETQAFLNLLADSIGTARLLLLVNYRPEYSHQWNSKTYYTQLRLDPLATKSAGEMLQSLIGDAPELAPLKDLIVDKTEGNPFFMEEIVQALHEEGALTRNGAVHLTRALDALKIPATVQAILVSRIDRLPGAGKELLQTLAVLGTAFSLALAREVVKQPEDELNHMLNDLQLAEFIYEQPAVGDIEYTFKHALTQEVAYNSLLTERRKTLHERVGGVIETLYSDSLDDHVDQLAHHYRRSVNAAKAIQYISRAAEQAVARNAFNQAVVGYKDGLARLSGIADQAERDRREAALQVGLGGVLSMGNPADAGIEDVYLRARELCARSGDSEGLFSTLFGLRRAYSYQAKFSRAMELCEEMLKIARDAEPSQQLSAHVSAAQTLYFLGEFSAASQHLEQLRQTAAGATQPKASQVRRRMMIAEPRSRNALILGLLGYPDRAAQEEREALAYAREQPVSFAVAGAEYLSAQLYYFTRDARKVREHGEVASRLANQFGSAQLSGYAAAFMGWVEALHGDPATGIKEIRRAMEQVEFVGCRIHTLQDALLIECLLRQNEIREGLAAASHAVAHAQRTGERYCLCELNRLKGELLILDNEREAAAAAFRTGIEVAREQQARWWELRATTSLARLLDKQGKREEARAMLTEVYNWFTEGFDTVDLKGAKALLEELGR